jgi:hypothetical protein
MDVTELVVMVLAFIGLFTVGRWIGKAMDHWSHMREIVKRQQPKEGTRDE